ncbi:MAG: alpha/beta hydrolase fold protein [Actinomycetia bacterium]|nr:alpha/beta hydrolase fold protein [Actinomycetes bacterium]
MTTPVPHWPGRMVSLTGDEQVWLAETPAGGQELVLCVHGMSGAATNWTDLMAGLAPDFDCVALDLPGSGFSPPPKTRAGYSVSAEAGTVIRLIEFLGAAARGAASRGRGVHLIGNSMGGAVSVRVAARRPDLVRTLTLISPALPDLKVRRSVAHFPVLALPVVGERLVRQWASRYPVESRVAGVFGTCMSDPSCVHPDRFAYEVEALRRRDALPCHAASLIGASRTLVAETLRPYPFSLWQAAGRVTAPSLVLFGGDDRLVHPRLADRAARVFRDARVRVLPETGHLAQFERPELVAALFREMVEDVRTRGTDAGNSGRRDPVDAR